MRSRILWISLFAAVLLFLAKPGRAQQCYSYSSDLGEYISESSDGTSIYVDVGIDGSEDMNLWGQCAEFGGSVVHTPWVLNQLNGQGGWQPGSGVCGSCYISDGTEEEITPNPGDGVDCEYEVTLDCNFGGTIFDSGGGSFSTTFCTFTISPSIFQASNCVGQPANKAIITANLIPSSSQCFVNPSGSSCGLGAATGNIDLVPPCTYITAPTGQPTGTFNYFAGPGTSGKDVGTIVAGFNLLINTILVTKSAEIPVQCP